MTRSQKDRKNTLRHLRSLEAPRWQEIDAINMESMRMLKASRREARANNGAWALALFDKLGGC
jgi:hypothetical protein